MVPYEACRMGRGMLLTDEGETGILLQPLLRMPNGDLRHPYNFGGPIATPGCKTRPSLRGPVFCTLHPFLIDAQRTLIDDPEYSKEVVWADLTQPSNLRATTRHCVEKATRAGAYLLEVRDTLRIIQFFTMYDGLMRRNNAKAHWLFSAKWFASFMSSLDKNATMFLAYNTGELRAGCILLHGFGTCYYHFAASTGKDPNINHFMVAKAMEWAREQGYKRFHLGGGVEPDDGLFRFKSGFSELRAPVYHYSGGTSPCHVDA